MDIKTNNEVTDVIKLDFQKYNALVIEPTIKYDFKKECEITFEYDGYKNEEEFSENVSSYVLMFDKALNKRNEILKSLYNAALQMLIDWEKEDEINIDNISNYISVRYVEVYEKNLCIKATAWNHDTDEELLGGHFIEAFIYSEQIDQNNINWHLS